MMLSVFFDVDSFDTVKACMLECMKAQQVLKNHKVIVSVRTMRDHYNHIKYYEMVFKNDADYAVYQFIK